MCCARLSIRLRIERVSGNQICLQNPIPPGLVDSSRLPEAIFTPATKSQTGHDINIGFEQVVEVVGGPTAVDLRELTLEIYQKAAKYAEEKGVIIADTKFEFGLYDGEIILCDEVLTPDSSRFWPKADYHAGGPQKSLDKQFVRDYLESIKWNKQPPAPPLPPEIAQKTSEKYRELYRWMTGKQLN